MPEFPLPGRRSGPETALTLVAHRASLQRHHAQWSWVLEDFRHHGLGVGHGKRSECASRELPSETRRTVRLPCFVPTPEEPGQRLAREILALRPHDPLPRSNGGPLSEASAERMGAMAAGAGAASVWGQAAQEPAISGGSSPPDFGAGDGSSFDHLIRVEFKELLINVSPSLHRDASLGAAACLTDRSDDPSIFVLVERTQGLGPHIAHRCRSQCQLGDGLIVRRF